MPLTLIEWDRWTSAFVSSSTTGLPAVPAPDSVTWWHAASQVGATPIQSSPGVTHLGDHDSAVHRADVQALRTQVTGIYEVELPAGLSVLPEAYVENYGQDTMKAFEGMLLDSGCDVAYTWNTTESAVGAWSLIVRAASVGIIPTAPAAGVSVVSQRPWTPGQFYNQMRRSSRLRRP